MVIIVLGMIGICFCINYGFLSLSSLILIFIFSVIWMNAEDRCGSIIGALHKSGYPDDKCITPEKLKFLFEYREDMDGGYNIPKEFVQMNIIGFYNVIISAIIIFCVRGKVDGGISLLYAEVDIAILSAVMLLLRFKAGKVAFQGRYKKMNRYNWRYLFGFGTYIDSDLQMIGTCRIVAIKRKGRRKYVTIKLLSTGEKMKNILFCGRLYKGNIYMLYEICHLKYVDHIPPQKVSKPIENCKIIGGKTIRQQK